MENAGVRYLRTSCWRIRNRTSERSERVRFLIQKQRVRKYRTKHFPCGIVFIIYILSHSSFCGPFYFKSFKNAKICRYTLTAKWQRKRSISFLVKTFDKNINDGEDMRFNPRTISNLNCLFSMHNWKWVNLSKMAGFNISLSLNERQSSSDKKHNKSLRLVLFIPFRCCFAGSLPYFFIDSETNETIPLHFRNVFHFFSEKNSLSKTFLVDKCVRSGAASCNKRREFWRETRTPLWLLIGRIIFLTREKTSFAILIGRIVFFTCENHRSLLWLARTNLRTKIYDIAFCWVFLSMYNI